MNRFLRVSASALTIVSILGLVAPLPALPALAAGTQVDLGVADDFAVLAGSAISDAGGSNIITGDVGLSPTGGTAITGLSCSQVGGGNIIYDTNAGYTGGFDTDVTCLVTDAGHLTSAKGDLDAAYLAAEGQAADAPIVGNLGGQTFTPGVYDSATSIGLTGTVTLDAQGDSNAVFIFQAGTTLTTAGTVSLINGAQACNVFWQVGSSATIGVGSNLKGNILAADSITDNGGSTVEGRLLARGAAVTLNSTDVTLPTCTGTITVTKVVVNDNGGTAVVADFPLSVNASVSTSGIANTYLAPGSYTVSETGPAGYTQAFSGACAVGTGVVSLDAHEVALCVITNDDIAVIPPPPPPPGGGGGGGSPPVPPLIDVLKVPSPLALPGGPGLVTYTYTLTNPGTVHVNDITMLDDSCGPVTFVSGDTDADARLDVSETWTYTCSTNLSVTRTNIVTATGEANGITAVDTSTATVIVGAPVVPPLIHVTKIPNPLALRAGGGVVTYTERITNPGTVPLSNVILTDDKCAPLTRISGDLDSDGQLDTNETWTYTCRTNLARTTTNVATATGEANGITATDFAIATVIVSGPTLPSAGTPVGGSLPWTVAMAGILVVGVASLGMVLRRRSI